jgi:ribonuclease HII
LIKISVARERRLAKIGFDLAVGFDEAGCGPLAGPVMAAATAVLDLNCRRPDYLWLLRHVDDSKKLSPKNREAIYQKITVCSNLIWAAVMVGNGKIDQINILEASKLAMEKAFQKLSAKLPPRFQKEKIFCLLDGNFSIKVLCRQESIVGGDGKVFSIALASIIAKVERDRLMAKMDAKYPAYGFARHKGYPTKAHYAALSQHGPCPIHRRSFRLVD